ncbi:hypothetical protein C5167_035144 [Papaver somniferum]|uniref:Uncharacterized protein n=1 Tax=Papaver somniferum TaxID=3469 RepID=A0A4Y7KHZ3_PAPSO|nr:hypothetical protein C5167_035144 [Papaver somniferum]
MVGSVVTIVYVVRDYGKSSTAEDTKDFLKEQEETKLKNTSLFFLVLVRDTKFWDADSPHVIGWNDLQPNKNDGNITLLKMQFGSSSPTCKTSNRSYLKTVLQVGTLVLKQAFVRIRKLYLGNVGPKWHLGLNMVSVNRWKPTEPDQ